MVERLVGSFQVSERHACRVLCVPPAGKRKAARQREERFKPAAQNQAWSMDFVADQLQDGTRFRSLTIVDVFTREAVAIEVDRA
jgi:putative transposase